jgi:AcrR family transcriptional regulator
MRRLAAELGVDPMAIYHHLPGKRAVLAGVTAIVFGELHIPALAGAAWQDHVRAFARAYHELARAHANLVLYLVTDPTSGGNAILAANEVLYAALTQAGLPPRMIVRAADLVVDYLHGFVLGERTGELGPSGESGERHGPFMRLDPRVLDPFPTLRQVFGSLAEAEFQADVEDGLDIILAGIEAMASSAA